MREMVLNHASLVPPDEHTCRCWLRDLAVGMRMLISHGAVGKALRSSVPPEEIWCLPSYSLRDAMYSLKATARDESLFLLGLTTKAPLLIGLGATTKSQFLTCETVSLSPDDGEPLLICAIQNWITVSFPSKPDWEQNTLTVRFRQLLPSNEWREGQGAIDNLAYTEHAAPICERHRARVLSNLTPTQQWERREEAFPHLLFGLDVDDRVGKSGQLSAILQRLRRLNDDAGAWQKIGGPEPPWSSEVTPESRGTMNAPRLNSTRRFRSHDGTSKLFEWHAKFGSMRIHLIFDAASRTVEIGYIGPHLPLD